MVVRVAWLRNVEFAAWNVLLQPVAQKPESPTFGQLSSYNSSCDDNTKSE